ncbi:MAG: ATP-binding protein [Bacillota bacterium]
MGAYFKKLKNSKSLRYFIILTIFLLILLHVTVNTDKIKDLGRWNGFELSGPKDIATDKDGNTYVLDDGYKRIVKVDANNVVQYTIKGSTKRKNGFYSANTIEVDEEGNLYVFNDIIDIVTHNTSNIQIVRFDKNGRFDKVLLDVKSNREYDYMVHQCFQIKEGMLYYLLRNHEDQLSLWKKSVNGGEGEHLYDLGIAYDELNWFVIADEDKVYYTTYTGKFMCVGRDYKQPNFLSAHIPSFYVPAYLELKDDTVYVLDIGTNTVYLLDIHSNHVKVADESILRSWGYNKDKMLLRSLSLGPDHRLATIDALNGEVLIADTDKGMASSMLWLSSSIADKVKSLLFLLEILIGAILGIWLLIRRIHIIRRFVIAKQLGVFILLFTVAIAVFSSQTYIIMEKNLHRELQSRLLTAAHYGASIIDGDTLESIVSPKQWHSKEYYKIEEDLERSINYSQDSWNFDMYAEAYKVRDGNFYYDYFAVYDYDDVPVEHRLAYTEGRTSFAHYRDSYGTWFSGVSPIRNSRKEIVGVYECYIDASIIMEKRVELIKGLLYSALIFFGIFVSIFIIYSNYELRPIKVLKEALARVSAGKYNKVINIERQDEIGSLVQGFNHMTGELKKYSEKMELLVEQRTMELQHTLEELKQAQMQLVQTEKMAVMGQLAAGIVHEMNTPIASLKSNLEIEKILIERLGSAEGEALEDLKRKLLAMQANNRTALDRQVEFLKSLKSFVSLDEAEYKEANVHESLDNALLLLNHEIKGKEVSKSYGAIPNIYCYLKQLNQAMLNIIANVIQYVPSNGVLSIRTESADDKVIIRFGFSGDKISNIDIEKLFDPTFTTSGSRVASGLGLTSAYKIIEQHGGRMKVENLSEEGENTEFIIELPVGKVGGDKAK